MGLLPLAVLLVVVGTFAVVRGRRTGWRAGLATLVIACLVIVEVGFYGIAAAAVLTLLAGTGLLALHEADRRRRSAERDRARRARRSDEREEWSQTHADAA